MNILSNLGKKVYVSPESFYKMNTLNPKESQGWKFGKEISHHIMVTTAATYTLNLKN